MLTKCQACQREIPSAATSCPNCGHPNVPANGNAPVTKRSGCATAILWIVGGFVAFAILGAIFGKPDGDHKPASNSVLDDQAFLAKNPQFPDGVRGLIRLDGYECPALAQLWMEGESPYGPKLEALCGPDNGRRDSYSNLHYLVFPKQGKVQICKPFGPTGGGCD